VRPLVVILSSPSGAGKTTIARAVCAGREDVAFSISATTRSPRPGERDGVDYYFLSREEFLRRRDGGEFLEWAGYSGHLYGTLEAEVDRHVAGGQHVILDIEPQGALQVRERRDDVVAIFVLPPSAAALRSRLEGRSSERPEEMAHRLVHARWELQQAAGYDFVVVNDELEEAVDAVRAVLNGEPHRVTQVEDLEQTIETLRRDLATLAQAITQ